MTSTDTLRDAPAIPPGTRRILLIEDDPDNRDTLQMVIETWGHQVETAENGQVGVQKALAWQPDAAVVDINLPILDGHQVAQRVRQAFGDRIRLIALTAYSQPEDRRRAMASGFDFFLTKPADLEELERLLAG
jgi:CheY-like chemotaxis protein